MQRQFTCGTPQVSVFKALLNNISLSLPQDHYLSVSPKELSHYARKIFFGPNYN